VNYGPILNADIVPQPNVVNIAPQYRAIPNAATVAGYYIPNNCCIFSDETIVSKRRSFPVKFSDYCHYLYSI
jgi:hypothetical protein